PRHSRRLSGRRLCFRGRAVWFLSATRPSSSPNFVPRQARRWLRIRTFASPTNALRANQYFSTSMSSLKIRTDRIPSLRRSPRKPRLNEFDKKPKLSEFEWKRKLSELEKTRKTKLKSKSKRT